MKKKRLLNIFLGIISLSLGIFLATALFFVFSGRIKFTQDMAFGVAVSLIGCPVTLGAGLNFIFNKNATL